MILGIIGVGILTGLFAGTTALIAGHSILMALGLYTLFGTLTVLGGVLLTYTIQSAVQFRQRRQALPG